MEPAIGVDSERLAREVAEVCRLVDALEQRQESCIACQRAPSSVAAQMFPPWMPMLWVDDCYTFQQSRRHCVVRRRQCLSRTRCMLVVQMLVGTRSVRVQAVTRLQ